MEEICANCVYVSYVLHIGYICCKTEHDDGMVYDVYEDETCNDFHSGE